jgi:hypothetical protein
VCTSLDEPDSDRDISALDELLRSQGQGNNFEGITRTTQPNPFASAMPELWSAREGEQSEADRITYANAYRHVLRRE